MPFSMTGFGRTLHKAKGLEIAVEIRSVNHRHLQIRQHIPDFLSSWEPRLEELARKRLQRGSVTISLAVTRDHLERGYTLRSEVARSYFQQLEKLKKNLHLDEELRLAQIVQLPGVVEIKSHDWSDVEQEYALFAKLINQTINKLNEDRAREGLALAKDLNNRCAKIKKLVQVVEKRVPLIVRRYHEQLKKRLEELLKDAKVKLREEDLAREVAIYADRSDISEEMTRLRSHLDAFVKMLGDKEQVGRRLEFLLQEMHRETNTLGAKSSDAPIAHHVVEIKSELEKMREQVQNLE